MRKIYYVLPDVPHIALLADFHNCKAGDIILRDMREHKPDIIAIAGDVVYGRNTLSDQKNVLPFLEGCVGTAPTFMSLGNHECGLTASDIRRLGDMGAAVLDNEYVQHGGLIIGGLTSGYIMARRQLDMKQGEYDEHAERPVRQADLSWLSGFMAGSGRHILLSHHPEYFDRITDTLNDIRSSGAYDQGVLILSGHAHGGQWRFYDPVRRMWRGVFAPGQGLFPKLTRGCFDGRHNTAECSDTLVISAGLANTTRIPRFFNPTEIVHIIPPEMKESFENDREYTRG